ncbi:DNA-binding protein [Candidatus Sumerlaeota bacterium]|nr:DNA-binding protein [Candidatus Sumerlaeota bacterium]
MDIKKPKTPEESLVNASLLLDIYGEMLTERQRRFMRLHFDEDLSFSQIAREFGVSRQAVHDSVKHALAALEGFERALGLVEKQGRSPDADRAGLAGDERERIRQRLDALRDRVSAQERIENTDWLVRELDELIDGLQQKPTGTEAPNV